MFTVCWMGCKSEVWVSTVLQPLVFLSVTLTRLIGRKKAELVAVKASHKDLALVRDWVEAGRIRPIIHDVLPLDRIRDAHAQQETKHSRGKVIVSVPQARWASGRRDAPELSEL